MRRLIILVLACLLLTGAVQQSYYQVVERSGSSEIQRVSDIGLFANFLPPGSIDAMADVCEARILRCDLEKDELVLTLYDDFESDGVYYTLETDEGFLYTGYTMTIVRIPTDRFSELTEELLMEAGAVEADGSPAAAIVLGSSETRSMAREMAAIGVEITYTVELPGEITEARSGDVEAAVSGNTAEFDLLEVMVSGENIVVKSREFNFLYILLIAIVIVMGALALSFFWEKKPKK